MPVAEENGVMVPFDSSSDGMEGFIAVDEISALTLGEATEATQPKPTAPAKPIVGIIYPPPEVRNIVDKTATFVARNGPDFEIRIKQNEQNNSKFNFLNPGDPYHAYYRNKVKEIQEGKVIIPGPGVGSAAQSEAFRSSQLLIEEAKKRKQIELLKQVELPFVPKDPPIEFEFVADPPSISAQDLDVVKLTAQFVARNGRQFLSTLMTREQRNYQFDFLRPQHSLFQYFTKLLEQYTQVLIPPKDIVRDLGREKREKILESAKYRANWIKHQQFQKRKVEEEAEKERMAYSSIDWHDFVVVETVDYQPFEQGQFPPPTTPQEVGARVLLQDRILQQGAEKEAVEEPYHAVGDDTQVQDMEEDSDSSSEEDEPPKPPLPPPEQERPALPIPEPPREDQVVIKKGYDPKQAKVNTNEKVVRAGPKPDEYTISPITGERIPVSKLQEHMRIGLLDPKWKDQRDRQLMEKVNQESVFAAGFAVDESLKQFAERRSDIFGVGVEETPIGKKIGEEERIPGMPWDPTAGLSSSMTVMDDKTDETKKDQIGPIITQAPPVPNPNAGILKPPTPAQIPQIPGVVRPIGMPQGGMMMMQNLQRVGPLLGPPAGYPGYVPPSSARPPLLPTIPPPMKTLQPMPVSIMGDDEPSAKKAKSLEDSLIPEAQFYAMTKSPTTFTVVCPSYPEKPEMNLTGQIISVTMGLNEPISLIKTKIHELIGLAPGKQKLSVEGLFFKDTNTLAYYNIGERTTVQMSLKERGGRKK